MPPIGLPLTGSNFTLDSSAVAGFFGGKEAISAMATVHLYEGRRWLGWYNSPGSYTVAKRFGRMANSRFWDGLFPGPNDSPAVSLGLDGKKGPEYIAALSGTQMPTGHLAYLTMERSKETKTDMVQGRETKPCYVTYLAMKPVNYDASVKRLPVKEALWGFFPICISVITCILCALVYDWYSFSMILLGIICSGYASVVIGRGRLVLKSVNNPANGSPPGHGILKREEDVVVIKGKEEDVNAITKGHFDLDMDLGQGDKKQGGKRNDEEQGCKKEDETGKRSEKQGDKGKGTPIDCHHNIGICSFLLLLQFLMQLLLVPQGTLFGQIMFIVSLGASWAYNSYLSSLEKEKIQMDLLFNKLEEPEMCWFRVGTRTTMAVFVCLLLFHSVNTGLSEEEDRNLREKILHSCLPNDTVVWRRWRRKVVDQLLHVDYKTKSLSYLQPEEGQIGPRQGTQLSQPPGLVGPEHNAQPPKQNTQLSEQNIQLSDGDKTLLDKILEDAAAAFKGYFDVCETLPIDSAQVPTRRTINGDR